MSGTCHSPECLHLHPLRMAVLEIERCRSPISSYTNTSVGVMTVMYWALANFLALISDFCFKFGTISTVCAGSLTLWWSFALTLDHAVVPVGVWKILLDFSFVKIKSSPTIPQLDVAPVSKTAVLVFPVPIDHWEVFHSCNLVPPFEMDLWISSISFLISTLLWALFTILCFHLVLLVLSGNFHQIILEFSSNWLGFCNASTRLVSGVRKWAK